MTPDSAVCMGGPKHGTVVRLNHAARAYSFPVYHQGVEYWDFWIEDVTYEPHWFFTPSGRNVMVLRPAECLCFTPHNDPLPPTGATP